MYKLFFEMHLHTTVSDGFIPPDKVINLAKQKGLNGVAITDHNTIEGGILVKELSKKYKNFFVIIGSEISTEKGHVIGLFLSEEIKSRKFDNVIREIKSQNGIVVVAHPFRHSLLNYKRKFTKLTPEDLKYVDFIEIFNARSRKIFNQLAYNLAIKNNKSMIVGSDAHFAWEIGNATSIIMADELNEISIKKSLLSNSIIFKKPLKKGIVWYYINALISKFNLREICLNVL